jgi:hypothetical protein
MRLTVAAALLLTAVARAAAQDPEPGFATTLPDAVGDVSAWEAITGDFEAARMRGSYVFYVNPARQAMYQLMRYRVELLGQADGDPRRAPGERVAFVRNPGAHEPMLIWARDGTGAQPAWRLLTSGTDEYKSEVGVLMGVIAVHRAARAGASP